MLCVPLLLLFSVDQAFTNAALLEVLGVQSRVGAARCPPPHESVAALPDCGRDLRVPP